MKALKMYVQTYLTRTILLVQNDLQTNSLRSEVLGVNNKNPSPNNMKRDSRIKD